MKTYFTLFILVPVFLVSTFITSFAQTIWEKYENNPVLITGSAGSWENHYVAFCSIIYDSTTSIFKMWYTGGQGVLLGNIGYATSPDGWNWEKYENNPVLITGSAGSWDDYAVISPSVVVEGNTYHMWYSGYDESLIEIGYATSSDGINWTKYENNPVLEVGPEGSWDENWVYWPSVIVIDSIFHMWYASVDDDKIGYATSPDGIKWTKHPSNPVLDKGPAGTWEDLFVSGPNVLFHDDTFHMWYYGGRDMDIRRIGYATSPDGLTWIKYENNPIFLPTEDWENIKVQNPHVLLIDSTFHMWYSGGGFFDWRIGYATAALFTGINHTDNVPMGYTLSQNYPNPFNPLTTIEFTLPKSENVELKVYNIHGKKVSTLVSKNLNHGNHTYTFDGKNLASGIYYYQLVTGNYRQVKKMILLK
jgi:predicted GH43/DUF377 family glycosyl hydrolase